MIMYWQILAKFSTPRFGVLTNGAIITQRLRICKGVFTFFSILPKINISFKKAVRPLLQ